MSPSVSDLSDLQLRLRHAQRDLDRREGEHDSLVALRERTLQEVEALKADIVIYDKVAMLLTSIGEERQFKAQESIEALVTQGLQTIFGPSLSFHIIQKVNGNKATVDFVVRTNLPGDRVLETNVLDARGGGLAAVIGFLLRLVVLLLRNDGSQKILILDETFAHVSDEYLPGVAEFICQLKEKTGVQIIMVTHQSEFIEYADKVYRFSLDKDENTKVVEEVM